MSIGVSSSCFYPLATEVSLDIVSSLGIKNSEIFFNSPSELSEKYLSYLKKFQTENEMKITALHPFRSFSEGYDLFSPYERRFFDGVESYKKYFYAAAELGAKYVIIHGAKNDCEIDCEDYALRYFKLQQAARQYGCDIAHENVVNYLGGNVDFMRFLAEAIPSFKAVLDVKQARRAGVDPLEFIDAIGENIVHVHLSDYNDKCDCIAPSSKGKYDFAALFSALGKVGYKGNFIVELYSSGFERKEELTSAVAYLEEIYKDVNKDLES